MSCLPVFKRSAIMVSWTTGWNQRTWNWSSVSRDGNSSNAAIPAWLWLSFWMLSGRLMSGSARNADAIVWCLPEGSALHPDKVTITAHSAKIFHTEGLFAIPKNKYLATTHVYKKSQTEDSFIFSRNGGRYNPHMPTRNGWPVRALVQLERITFWADPVITESAFSILLKIWYFPNELYHSGVLLSAGIAIKSAFP